MPIYLARNIRGAIPDLMASVRTKLENAPHSLALVVPTKRKIRDLQIEMLQNSPVGAMAGINLFTLELLARRLYDACCPPKRLVSPSIQAVLFQEATRDLHRRKELQYFGLHTAGEIDRLPPGTLQKIISVISMLKEEGVYVSDLRRELEEGDVDEREKLSDLAKIYAAYEERLGTELIDVGGIFREVVRALRTRREGEVLRAALPGVDLLVINGFDEFTKPELQMIGSLAGDESLSTIVSFDFQPENRELFGHLQENYQTLIDMGFRRVELEQPSDTMFVFSRPGDRELDASLARRLFRRDDSLPRLARSGTVTIFSAKDRQEEVRLIARAIKSWLIDHPGQRLDRICVATYQTQAYTALFRQVFAEYGIPANITDRYHLSQSPLVVAVLALLEVVKNNFRRKDVLRSLASPYLSFLANDGPVDASNLHTVSTNLKITAGASRWGEKIGKRIQSLESELSELDDEREEEDVLRELASLNKAKGDIVWLESLLRPFSAPMKPPEFKSALLGLLRRLRLTSRLFDPGTTSVPADHLEIETRAYQRFLSVLDDVLEFLEIQGETEKEWPIGFYVDQMRTALGQARFNIRLKPGYGVLVTSLEETRGLDFDVMVIAGLVDGEFPLTYAPEVFLSKRQQRRMEQYHLTENRYLFYQGVRNFKHHLYVSYPEHDGELELVPSPFIDSLLESVEVDDARASFAARFQNRILSRSELVKQFGARRLLYSGEPERELAGNLRFIRFAQSVEESRARKHTQPEFEGRIHAVLTPEGKAALNALRQRTYSVSQLETYGKCPFRFFAERVLHLNVIKEPEEGLSQLEKGLLLHQVLFEFYIDRRNRGLPRLGGCGEKEFADALADLQMRLERRLEEMETEDVFWDFDREMLLGGESRRGFARSFLEYERERALDVAPNYFEVSFGHAAGPRRTSDPLLEYEQPVTLGDVRLRGKVDRVELGPDAFTIVDYKTGKDIPRLKEIELGIGLQLPLYLAAVEIILKERVGGDRMPAAGIFLQLRERVSEKIGLAALPYRDRAYLAKKRTKQILESEAELRFVIARAIATANAFIRDIGRGEFPLTTEEKAKEVCPSCDYLTVCRIRAGRWIERSSGTGD